MSERAKVYLVGAGPGDPGLITWKGRKLLAIADSILYDNLANEHLLDLAPKNCERIYVGKKKSVHAFPQEEICAMMIDRARRGLNVVRLKGGDPFIFGRGGEELEALAEASIDFSVVPGITAASGCAAYAGIPLTHRDFAHSVTFVTGHADQGGREPDWRGLALPGTTAVFYMGLARLNHIVAKLIEHGASSTLPAALVAHGTQSKQRVIRSTLGDVSAVASASPLESPTLLIVGEVVALSEQLAWFNEHARDKKNLSQSA